LNDEAKGIVETMLKLTGPNERSGDEKVSTIHSLYTHYTLTIHSLHTPYTLYEKISTQVSAKEIRNALQLHKPNVLQVLGKQGSGSSMANKQWDMLLKYLEVLHSDNSKAVIKVADESYDGTGEWLMSVRRVYDECMMSVWRVYDDECMTSV
jgi:hypothetical protein